ncbi:predicted protein [Nematostella vectensis]|uniref:G-protein coupled receptors family 1 profile domain-containing protein n=1 Tax=Nematostella vectensis TaxID=45351 RepID=A7RQS9_NEMVE|nr:histamine H2 receptor [Nematostella vectensis]XP_032218859.1 histamine H2 receptor [Nematostella vectensis]EDO46219.1 predicted protein [Nematostella vectensis]|eukprot:XP_001638282.1 predicted protein [Nematostella vectensis]
MDGSLEAGNLTNSTEHGNPTVMGGFLLVYDSCLILLSVLIMATNGIVLLLFTLKPRLRTKTNCLLASLAVSDIGMGLCGIPTFIGCNVTFIRGLCVSSAVSYRFVAVSTMFHIFAVTVERYISIIYPLKYMAIVNRARIYRTITVIWLTSLFFAIVQLSWVNTSAWSPQTATQLHISLIYHSIGAVTCFVVPFVIMVFIYGQMFTVIHKQVTDIRKQHVATESNSFRPIYTELRAISVFATMLSIFAFCWITWYISIFGLYVEKIGVAFVDVAEVVWMICDFLRFSTSFLNPLLYTYLKYDFRTATNSVLCGWRERRSGKIIKTSQINETQCSLYDNYEVTHC